MYNKKVIEAQVNTEDEVFEIYEMAKICTLDDSSIEIFVNSDDGGKIPHFHVWKKLGGRRHEWEVCIKFESAEYFTHGKYKGTVPTKIAKEIDKTLRQKDTKDKYGRTNWDIAIEEWNRNNSDVTLPDDLVQPDYTKLNK